MSLEPELRTLIRKYLLFQPSEFVDCSYDRTTNMSKVREPKTNIAVRSSIWNSETLLVRGPRNTSSRFLLIATELLPYWNAVCYLVEPDEFERLVYYAQECSNASQTLWAPFKCC